MKFQHHYPSFFVLAGIVGALLSCGPRLDLDEVKSSLSECGESGDSDVLQDVSPQVPGQGDGPIFALAGCSDRHDQGLIKGGIGHINTKDPHWERHLAEQQASFDKAKAEIERQLADMATEISANSGCAGLLGGFSCDAVTAANEQVSALPIEFRGKVPAVNMSAEDKNALIKALHDLAVECRNAFDNGPTGGQNAGYAASAAKAWDAYLKAKYGADNQIGTVLGYGIVTYDQKTDGTQTTSEVGNAVTQSNGGGVSITANTGTSSEGGKSIWGVGGGIAGTVKYGTDFTKYFNTRDSHTAQVNRPPVSKGRVVVRMATPDGKEYDTSIELIGADGPVLESATGAHNSAFALREDPSDAKSAYNDQLREDREKRAQQAEAMRSELARQTREAEARRLKEEYDHLFAQLTAQQDEVIKRLSNLEVVTAVTTTDGTWLYVTPDSAATLAASYEFLYEIFPTQYTHYMNNVRTSAKQLENVMDTRRREEKAARVILNAGMALINQTQTSVDAFIEFRDQAAQVVRDHCPVQRIAAERWTLAGNVDYVRDLATKFRQHVGKVQSLVDAKAMKAFINDKEGQLVFADKILEAARLSEEKSICDATAALMSSLATKLTQATVQQANQEIRKTMSDAARALKEAADTTGAAGLRNQMAAETQDAIKLIDDALSSYSYTEGVLAASVAQEFLKGHLTNLLGSAEFLAQAEKDRIIAKLQNEIDEATEEFATISEGSGLRAMVVGRISRLNQHLAVIRSQILTANEARRNVLLDYWRLVATSSGLSFIPECLASGAAMLSSCWEVNTPPESAARSNLEILDKELMDFEANLEKLKAAATTEGD